MTYLHWLALISTGFVVLERLFPWRKEQRVLRAGWLRDLGFLAVNGHVFSLGTAASSPPPMLGGNRNECVAPAGREGPATASPSLRPHPASGSACPIQAAIPDRLSVERKRRRQARTTVLVIDTYEPARSAGTNASGRTICA